MTYWRQFIKNNCCDKDFELGLIWSKENALQQIAQEITLLIKNEDFNTLGCVETKGIIYAYAVSALCGKEIRIFRKEDKITYTKEKYVRKFINWQNKEDGIEIEKSQISIDDKIIIIDDIIDTGITLTSVSSIINEANAQIVKYICLKNISQISNIHSVPIISLL